MDNNQKFKLYDIVRYESGSTALMRITSMGHPHERCYGAQYFGGLMGCFMRALTPATSEEIQSFCAEELRMISQYPSRSHNLNSLIQETGQWAEQNFPNSTNDSITSHMLEEINELKNANVENMTGIGEEAADVFLLLAHLCHRNNINLGHHAALKLVINMQREWDTEPNEQGYFKHKAKP